MARTETPRRPRQQEQTREVIVFDPVRAGKELSAAIETRRPQLASLLGVALDSEQGKAILDRFVTVALHAATSNPDLLRATKESLVEAIRDSAVLGLEPVGATGDGAIVVYNEKVKRERPGTQGGLVTYEESVPTAHFQPMYRGLLKLARRSGAIAHIDAHVVYEGDTIEIDLGSVPSVRHFPVLDGTKRGNYVGAYAVAELANRRRYVEWMTQADIEIVRKKSRARDAMAWSDFWPEMARKTTLRRLMKRLPLETMAEHALRIENEAEERAVVWPPEQTTSTVVDSGARSRLRARFAPAAQEAASDDGEGRGDAEGGETPNQTSDEDPGASVASTGSEEPKDAVEGEVREVDDQVAAVREAFAGHTVGDPGHTTPTEPVCGAESDAQLGEVETCILEPGHSGPDGKPTAHQSEEGTRWPNR